MSSLMTRMFRTDPARARVLPVACAGCQVGQGRQCACKRKRKRRPLTVTEATWLVVVCNTAFLVVLGHVAGLL